jgi:hypothetical protein
MSVPDTPMACGDAPAQAQNYHVRVAAEGVAEKGGRTIGA